MGSCEWCKTRVLSADSVIWDKTGDKEDRRTYASGDAFTEADIDVSSNPPRLSPFHNLCRCGFAPNMQLIGAGGQVTRTRGNTPVLVTGNAGLGRGAFCGLSNSVYTFF